MNPAFAWDELALLWNANNFGAVHDWLGERWNTLIQTRSKGQEDPDAQFLQGLAFAALSFHFTQNHNQDGAALLAEDALAMLPRFLPVYCGLEIAPVLETLNTLLPQLVWLEHDADCPMQPFVFNKLVYQVMN
ncbi:MAG: hypothetical protein AUK53_03700 [Betaproteobacteria bacterium CG2_30_59_46]|nr:MAG: hypothetical protein AUK53_03700 [Betaproteobacteria bacterium CG2_30_59_46]PIQ09778.1 MAG: DUF309 domain-containing protein [Hydrogenophilales bacterium CG18_big_fil_WC_8_21_14_2_50_58_12]PIY00962.1 MAG: DUF309 domain-containing protein [Hydrogenophilales bacterium CG_4_10_14_3_um_filter_58_23]PJB07551.1 MAG: DUF309 domain-containing protein [Hydrogenophilales bacterium CG_4_9_14_3_um_filter_59_35]